MIEASSGLRDTPAASRSSSLERSIDSKPARRWRQKVSTSVAPEQRSPTRGSRCRDSGSMSGAACRPMRGLVAARSAARCGDGPLGPFPSTAEPGIAGWAESFSFRRVKSRDETMRNAAWRAVGACLDGPRRRHFGSSRTVERSAPRSSEAFSTPGSDSIGVGAAGEFRHPLNPRSAPA